MTPKEWHQKNIADSIWWMATSWHNRRLWTLCDWQQAGITEDFCLCMKTCKKPASQQTVDSVGWLATSWHHRRLWTLCDDWRQLSIIADCGMYTDLQQAGIKDCGLCRMTGNRLASKIVDSVGWLATGWHHRRLWNTWFIPARNYISWHTQLRYHLEFETFLSFDIVPTQT